MDQQVSLLVSIAAGIASFFSPCFLPLWPAYISFLAGSPSTGMPSVRTSLRVAVFFVLGFSVLFTLLGATATVLGSFLVAHQKTLRLAAGAVLIVFGFSLMGFIRLPQGHRSPRVKAGSGAGRAFLVGFVFAAGWTPCISPYLWPILALAATRETVARGVILLGAYSAGLGVPFIATALLIDRIKPFLSRSARYARATSAIAGIILCATGILMILGRLGI